MSFDDELWVSLWLRRRECDKILGFVKATRKDKKNLGDYNQELIRNGKHSSYVLFAK